MSLLFQKLLHLDGCHASRSGGGDRLAIATILDVPAGEDSGHARKDVIMRLQITILIGLQLSFEHFGIRNVSDS